VRPRTNFHNKYWDGVISRFPRQDKGVAATS
jgi:hypothetical protein